MRNARATREAGSLSTGPGTGFRAFLAWEAVVKDQTGPGTVEPSALTASTCHR